MPFDYSDRNHLLHQNSSKMKRYTHFAAAILFIGFTSQSCEKESFSRDEKFESLLSLPGASERRIAFNELASTGKADFWKYNLRKNMNELTGIQRKLVTEIYDQLTPAAYQNGSNDRSHKFATCLGRNKTIC